MRKNDKNIEITEYINTSFFDNKNNNNHRSRIIYVHF